MDSSQSFECRLSSESSQTIKFCQNIESGEGGESQEDETQNMKTEDIVEGNIINTVLSKYKCLYTSADQLQNKLDELHSNFRIGC